LPLRTFTDHYRRSTMTRTSFVAVVPLILLFVDAPA
jgi:hypothetical protein